MKQWAISSQAPFRRRFNDYPFNGVDKHRQLVEVVGIRLHVSRYSLNSYENMRNHTAMKGNKYMKKVEHECGIYAIVNKINNKSYIGKSIDIHTRWKEHIYLLSRGVHQNKHLQSAWNKYGEEAFEFIVIKTCKAKELNRTESILIALFNTTYGKIGYNYVGGGEGGAENNAELSKKRSDSLKKYYEENPDGIEKRREALKKAYENPELKEKIRQNTIELFKNPEFYRKYRELRSSEEYRKKISESHKGKKPTEEAIALSVEMMSKPVLCVETGVVYSSGREASRAFGGRININAVISGKRKTAGGYHWVRV